MFTLILRDRSGHDPVIIDIGQSVEALGFDIEEASYIGIQYNGADVAGVAVPSAEEVAAYQQTPEYREAIAAFEEDVRKAQNTDNGRLN